MKSCSRFVTSLLLVLLPMQATAVVMACPHARASAEAAVSVAAAEPAPCMHGAVMAVPAGDDAGQPLSGPSDSACCASSAACMMCGLAFDGQHKPLFEQRNQLTGPPAVIRFTSFYPEGLQRPPCNIA